MATSFMPEDKAIAMHLIGSGTAGPIVIKSGLRAGLEDARSSTGRFPATGAKIIGASHGSWLGAVGYMIVLDQIGSCFKPESIPPVSGNTIEKALSYFSNLNQAERNALYALRCAFAHDYSLYNVNSKKPEYTHQFGVGVGTNAPVVTLPQQAWDGDYNRKPDISKTIINLEAFGDLVEDVFRQLWQLAESQQLEVVLEGGSDALLQRYAFFYRTN